MSTKKVLLLWLLALLIPELGSARWVLSPESQISIITCDPGGELYSIFGHTAIRIQDPVLRRDRVYNYGTFDFAQPGFVLKFTRGKLLYYLNGESIRSFVGEYVHDNRPLREQVLNLNAERRQAVVDYLETNALPENRMYKYDFFFDNCSSRVRDMLEKLLGEDLRYPKTGGPEDMSLREMLDDYLAVVPWTGFGIDLLLGVPADEQADYRNSVFLPDYLYATLANAEVKVDGNWEPLVAENVQLFEGRPTEKGSAPFFQPWMVTWPLLLAGLGLIYLGWKRKRLYKGFDVGLFMVIGLIGVLIFLLWFATDHDATKANLNIFWALPTHLFLAIFLLVPSARKLVVRYAQVTGAIALLYCLSCWILPQGIHPAAVPLFLLVAIRLLWLGFAPGRLALPD